MTHTEAQDFIERMLELAETFESHPALLVRRDAVVKSIMRQASLNQVPAEVLAVACQTVVLGLMSAGIAHREKPLVELVQ